MGCAVSKNEEEDDVVSLCRDRNRLIKSAIERRYALAEAYCKYNKSLYAVAVAIRLFVARHCSPSSPFLITLPQHDDSTNEIQVSNAMHLQQRPSESRTHEAVTCKPQDSAVSSHSSNPERIKEEDSDEDAEREVCEHFYDEVNPPMASTQNDFGWDFFNPFGGVRTEVVHGFAQSSDDDLRAVREAEGIPELEEVEERESRARKILMGDDGGVALKEGKSGVEGMRTPLDANVIQEAHNGLRVIDTPTNGRELLEALKDVEDYFIRAYDSGLDVSKMLETNAVHLQTDLEEIKVHLETERSNKLVQSIKWRRSTSSRSSSCKSFLSSSSKSSSIWTDFSNDLFDDYGGMESGSHSLTLGRLYAWEKKLYEEVKAGDQTRKIYDRKCSRLRSQEASGDGFISVEKAGAEVRVLYSSLLVTAKRTESISKRIQKLRDEELQLQLVELIHGLMKAWKVMLELHQTQFQTMSEVKSFTCPAFGKFSNASHRLATLQLEAELQNWRACFHGYISAQKAYIEALSGWLSKFIAPEFEFYSRVCSSAPQYRIKGPPLLVICHDWLASLEKLPDKAVTYSMKSFGKDIRALWAQQDVEEKQKRKVDGLAMELDRRMIAFQREERKTLDSKLSGQKTDLDMRHWIEYLAGRKDQLDIFMKRVDTEKSKHQDSMQETQRIFMNGFQTGFSSVFESLMEFSRASVRLYSDLVAYGENAKVGVGEG